MKMIKFSRYVVLGAALAVVTGCNDAKLSTIDNGVYIAEAAPSNTFSQQIEAQLVDEGDVIKTLTVRLVRAIDQDVTVTLDIDQQLIDEYNQQHEASYELLPEEFRSFEEVELTYVAADGEEGFPGNITCKVLMKLTDDNAIDIRYEAETDKPTIVNMTNHSYFNLDGDAANNADHLLMVDADYYTPVDSTFMTTGEIVPVEGTPMDFRTPTPVGARINDYDFVQLKNGNGYDHNWVLNAKGDISRKCASLESPKTGIVLDVYTNEPGVQVYAGNFLDGSLTGKKGITYNQRASVCLETQKYPDTPNKPEWPSAVLRPGEKYMSQCIFKFSVDKE